MRLVLSITCALTWVLSGCYEITRWNASTKPAEDSPPAVAEAGTSGSPAQPPPRAAPRTDCTCNVAGMCVGSGQFHPYNPCQVCDPAQPSGWRNMSEGDACDDG